MWQLVRIIDKSILTYMRSAIMQYALPSLLTNIAIVIAVITVALVLFNPLALFGLLLLKEMPIVVPGQTNVQGEEVGEYEGSGTMGFM